MLKANAPSFMFWCVTEAVTHPTISMRNYLLAGLKAKKKMKKSSPGFRRLPWDEWEATNKEIENVACKLLSANCYNPNILHYSQQPPQNSF